MAPSVKQRKIAILGSRSVGKSSLTVQFVEGHFVESYYPTIENTFSREIKYNGQSYLTEIIDTAGQDEYSLLNSKHFIGLHGYVLVYSVASRQSFEMIGIIRDKILNHLGAESVPMMIIGNKSDVGPKRKVTAEEGQKLGQDLHCGWIETSARENKNVAKAFEMMIAEIEKAAEPDKPAGGGNKEKDEQAKTNSAERAESHATTKRRPPKKWEKGPPPKKWEKRPPPKKWDPFSQQGRSDLQGVLQQLQQLQEADFPAPESADQLVELPQSPILRRQLGRRRQRPAKRQPTAEERALENDPWAAILAQPVRMEIATRARMPAALMSNWALVGRPDTEDVYVLPDALADLDGLEKMEEKSKRSALLNPGTGPAIRLLPSAKLMDRLTQIYTFVERPDNPSSPRLMRRSVDLISILPQLWRERIARVRHYDSNRRYVEASAGNKETTAPPLEATISKTNLKWQPDIEHRLLNILRTRLAVCLKRVLHLASTSTNGPTSIQLQPALPLLHLLRENDGRSQPHVDAAPTAEDKDAALEPAHSDRWGPYSPPRILLYFSTDPADNQALQRLSATNPLATIPGIKPTTYIDESETALEKVPPLLPPLVQPADDNNHPYGRRVPLFPMHALLDAPQCTDLAQAIRQSSRDWLPWEGDSDCDGTPQTQTDQDRPFILSITADAPCADVLFAEIWRLWRYVGGTQCMTPASTV
ncbi:hypothetical protein DV735_g2051, partial [Chaetothyriales sp. CBS 134920]